MCNGNIPRKSIFCVTDDYFEIGVNNIHTLQSYSLRRFMKVGFWSKQNIPFVSLCELRVNLFCMQACQISNLIM